MSCLLTYSLNNACRQPKIFYMAQISNLLGLGLKRGDLTILVGLVTTEH